MKYLSRLEPLFFYALLAGLLIPIWSVDFFVTGDGPCHLHNSKILLDFWQGTKVSFYDPFYYINPLFDPNRLFYLITAPLLNFLSPEITDKFFFSFYVLGFGFGFRFLISGINPQAKFISSIGLLFCVHKLLMMGFLNNSLSLVIWFWLAGWWWRNRDEFKLGTLLLTAVLFLLLYSTHPIGLIFGLLMLACMVSGLLLFEYREAGRKESFSRFNKRVLSIGLSALPAVVLFVEYLMRSQLSRDTGTHSFRDALHHLVHLSALVSMHSAESIFALLTAMVCFLLFLAGLVFRWSQKKWMPQDGLILFFGVCLLLIIYPPGSISGGLDLSTRLVILPFLAMLCWIATANFPLGLQFIAQITALILGICFVAVRLPVHRESSAYAKEILSSEPYIQDTSTVLVLNYDWGGQTPEGKLIADRLWLFVHVDCYLGTEKSLIISDNYEAHFTYFPVAVRWNTDMYQQTDKDQINFDHRPPRADILSYNRRTKQNIDYVLMISYREEFRDHPYTIEIFDQLAQGYTKVFTSAHGRAILYKRNNL